MPAMERWGAAYPRPVCVWGGGVLPTQDMCVCVCDRELSMPAMERWSATYPGHVCVCLCVYVCVCV